MRRFRLSWLLILALLAATLAPAQAGWFCASGLPCALGMARMRSAIPRARMRSAAALAAHDCCHKSSDAPSQVGSGTRQALNASQGCHFRGVVVADRALVGSHQAPQIDAPAALVPQPLAVVTPVPAGTPAWAPNPDGYRPPPLRDSGPSRAPPAA